MCVAKGVPGHFADPAAAKVTWLDNPLMSNHRVHSDGYGHAVDLAPYPIDWNDHDGFRRLGALIKRAAAIEGIALAWGGDWRRPDLPHYELAA